MRKPPQAKSERSRKASTDPKFSALRRAVSLVHSSLMPCAKSVEKGGRDAARHLELIAQGPGRASRIQGRRPSSSVKVTFVPNSLSHFSLTSPRTLSAASLLYKQAHSQGVSLRTRKEIAYACMNRRLYESSITAIHAP